MKLHGTYLVAELRLSRLGLQPLDNWLEIISTPVQTSTAREKMVHDEAEMLDFHTFLPKLLCASKP